jgi:NADPH-dependent glutamate synthase beta subunit-like oxidoreductase
VRAKTFDEAVSALRPDEAHAEASRCLRCDIRETVAHAVPRG